MTEVESHFLASRAAALDWASTAWNRTSSCCRVVLFRGIMRSQSFLILPGRAVGGQVGMDIDDVQTTYSLTLNANELTFGERWPGLSAQRLATDKWIVCRLLSRIADMGRHAGRA